METSCIVRADGHVSPRTMIRVHIASRIGNRGQIDKLFFAFFDKCRRRDNLRYLTFNNLPSFWFTHLFSDSNFISMSNQPSNILIYTMEWHACHWSWIFTRSISWCKSQIKHFGSNFRVFIKRLIKISHTKKKNTIRMLLLHISILFLCWG